MFFTIEAAKLQTMTASAMKSAGNNKLLHITSLIELQFEEDTLHIQTTDGVNTLRLTTTISTLGNEEDGFATVDADMFSKLVSKLGDCSAIELETDEKLLIVRGYKGVKNSGVYKLEMPIGEDGGPIDFPSFDNRLETIQNNSVEYTIPRPAIIQMLTSAKQALASDVSESCYKNYLVSNKIVTTDRIRAVFIEEDICGDKPPFLLERKFTDLFDLCDDDMNVTVGEQGIYATNGNDVEILSLFKANVKDFDEKSLSRLLSISLPSMCKVNKNELISALNRMALFCSKYEDNSIRIDFGTGSLIISSLKDSAVEEIEYSEFKEVEEFSVHVDVTLLLPQIKSNISGNVEIGFGVDNCIKIIDGTVTEIIALVVQK